jgi:peptide/nickel transport system permease protein
MQAYIIRRLLLIIPTLLIVTVIVFFTARLIPGSAVEKIAFENVGGTTGANIEDSMQAIRHRLGLDLPAYVQYGRWIRNIVLHGDLGRSLWGAEAPVSEEILNRLPVSFELGLLSMTVALLIAIPVGVYSGIRQDTVGDYVARSFAICCIAFPSFWVGTLILIYPAIWWQWSPPIEYVPFTENPLANLGIFIIPALVFGMSLSGLTMRLTRTMMLEVLRQDYMRTAWSKGLRERVVVLRHGLKNALLPIVSLIGIQLPVLIGGSVVIEQLFLLPGIGRLLLDAVGNRDYTALSGINLFMATFVLLANLGVDILYSHLDPRVRYR